MLNYRVASFAVFGIFFIAFQFVVNGNDEIANRATRKCLHRGDKRFHQNPQVENKLLRDAFDRYDELHANCYKKVQGNFTTEIYTEHHKVHCKYIIFKMDASGLGNRVMSMLSFYLFGLLTDRILLIQSDQYDLTEAFCQPFFGSDWFLQHSQLDKLPHRIHRIDAGSHMLNSEPNGGSHPILYVHDNEQYLILLLFANKHFTEKLHMWFPTKNVATILIRRLLHPQNDIWENIVKSWLVSTRNASDLTLGLQYRWGYVNLEASTCLPDIPDTNVFVYIASMGNQGEHIRKDHPGWRTYQRFAVGGEQHSINQVKTAVHDIWLLSMTDSAVIAKGSTFGYMIMALKGEPLQMMNMGNGGGPLEGYAHGHCFTPNTHEPCCPICAVALGGAGNWNTTYGHMFVECVDLPGAIKLSLEW